MQLCPLIAIAQTWHKMAAFISRIFWLHFWIKGGSHLYVGSLA